MKLRLFSCAIALLAFASCRNVTSPGTPPTSSGSWTSVNSGSPESLIVGQFVNATAGFVTGQHGTVLVTNDAGKTWSTGSPAPCYSGSLDGNLYGISFFDAQNGIVAGDQRDISKTTDGGYTWQPMDASYVPQSDLIRSMYFTNRNTGFIGTSDVYAGPSGSICQTTDGGQTWYPVFTTHGGIYNMDFNIPGSNGMHGVATGRYGVDYWTTDGGTTWHPGSSDQPNSLIYSTTFTSATTGFAVAVAPITGTATTGYILSTLDGGHTWATIKTIASGLFHIATNGAGTVTAVGQNGTVIESTDGGTTWTPTTVGPGNWNDIIYVNPHHAVLFGANGAIDVRDN